MILYHGTSALFDKFDLSFAVRDGMAGNGHLGVWLATDQDVAMSFGEYCLEVSANFSKTYSMDIGYLSRLNSECCKLYRDFSGGSLREAEFGFYRDVRERLVSAGYDSIAIREFGGEIRMYVALLPELLCIECYSPDLSRAEPNL
ncbi:TPA: hypothetical protein ACQQ5N_002778 [Pseudomonas aeruginosa]